MQILPFHRVLVTIGSHFRNFPPKALHAIVVLNAKWGGCEVSESEGLGVSESVCPCSFQIRAAKTKFPNPTLKFPNPGGAASFRIRRPASFRIRELRSFRIRGAASFRIRGPGSFRIRGPGSFQIRGCSFRIWGAAKFPNPRASGSFRIRGLAKFPNPRAWKFPNPPLKFPNPAGGEFLNPRAWEFPNPGGREFPNPRAWEFPNPTLKFPNPTLAQ